MQFPRALYKQRRSAQSADLVIGTMRRMRVIRRGESPIPSDWMLSNKSLHLAPRQFHQSFQVDLKTAALA
jgi:hypothetical protein